MPHDISTDVLNHIRQDLFNRMCEAGPSPLESQMIEVIELVLEGYDQTLEQSPDWRWLTPTHTELIDL